jgi:protein gp37
MGVRPFPLHHGRWWDATVNFVGGCVMADDSCFFCYAPVDAAGVLTSRDIELYKGTTVFKNGRWTWSGLLTERPPEDPTWNDLLNFPGVPVPLLELVHGGKDKPSLVWLNSMADIYVPRRGQLGRRIEVIDRIFETITLTPHIGLVLTKYPEQLVEYFRTKPDWWKQKIWLGFSAGDQRWWDVRWKVMRPLAQQGWLVFTSIAPMLGPVVPPDDFLRLGRWVICGGEQPPGNRVMNPDWVRSLRDQCVPAGMPLFVKQMTRGWLPPDLLFRQFPKL